MTLARAHGQAHFMEHRFTTARDVIQVDDQAADALAAARQGLIVRGVGWDQEIENRRKLGVFAIQIRAGGGFFNSVTEGGKGNLESRSNGATMVVVVVDS